MASPDDARRDPTAAVPRPSPTPSQPDQRYVQQGYASPPAVDKTVEKPGTLAADVVAGVAATGRSIAPDLARGLLLLFIALANAPWYLWGRETGFAAMHPWGAEGIDRVYQTISIIAIDGRTYPMFAFLFGYGIIQLYRKQRASGLDRLQARTLLRRRHWWMLAFGLVHAALLWSGDVIGAYGLAGLLIVWLFLDRTPKTIRAWAIGITSVLAAFGLVSLVGGLVVHGAGIDVGNSSSMAGVDVGIATESYLASVGMRTLAWFGITGAQATIGGGVPLLVLIAFLVARRRVLENPNEHRTLLRRTAAVGIGIGWATGALTAAQHADLFGMGVDLGWTFIGLGSLGGVACGLGYVALFALIGGAIERRPAGPGPIARAIQAVGFRSMTCYVLQSVIMAPVLSAWGLGLGGELSSWSMALFAAGVWLVTVIVAVALQAAGRRGPAEWALRRLSYRTPPQPAWQRPVTS